MANQVLTPQEIQARKENMATHLWLLADSVCTLIEHNASHDDVIKEITQAQQTLVNLLVLCEAY